MRGLRAAWIAATLVSTIILSTGTLAVSIVSALTSISARISEKKRWLELGSVEDQDHARSF